jgi:hypothetical protein
MWAFGDITTVSGPWLEGTVAPWRSTEDIGSEPPRWGRPAVTGRSPRAILRAGRERIGSIAWSDVANGDDGCDETVLYLDLPKPSSGEQRLEAVKVAASLIDVEGG